MGVTAEEQALSRRRTRMLLVNLAYFLVLLALGVLFFLKGAGGTAAYALLVLCVAGYLLLVRPLRGRYAAAVRETVIRQTVGAGLDGLSYAPKGGVTAQAVQVFFPAVNPGAFMSREHVTGHAGPIRAELADVTFPISEGGRNAMFSGAFVELTWPGAALPALAVRSGDTANIPKRLAALTEELGALIPGSLFLHSGGETLTLLLRGRFLGFPVNPLLPADRRMLQANPFPELDQAIRLIRLMAQTENPQPRQSNEKGVDRT